MITVLGRGSTTVLLQPDICEPLGCGLEERTGGTQGDQIPVPVRSWSCGRACVAPDFASSKLDIREVSDGLVELCDV